MAQKKISRSPKLVFFQFLLSLGVVAIFSTAGDTQERRAKVRISNAGFTITALPLLAAKDWGVFSANGVDVEFIVMSPTLAAAAVAQGDIDYVAGSDQLPSPLPYRFAVASDLVFLGQISYWLQSAPQYKTLQDLKGKKIAISEESAARTTWRYPSLWKSPASIPKIT